VLEESLTRFVASFVFTCSESIWQCSSNGSYTSVVIIDETLVEIRYPVDLLEF